MFRSVKNCLWRAGLLTERAVNSTAAATTTANSTVVHSATGDQRAFICDLLHSRRDGSKKCRGERAGDISREMVHVKGRCSPREVRTDRRQIFASEYDYDSANLPGRCHALTLTASPHASQRDSSAGLRG